MVILSHMVHVRWIPNALPAQTDTQKVKQRNCRNIEIFFCQELQTWPQWVHQAGQVSHLLTILNCSVNFYIYLANHGCTSGQTDLCQPWNSAWAVEHMARLVQHQFIISKWVDKKRTKYKNHACEKVVQDIIEKDH